MANDDPAAAGDSHSSRVNDPGYSHHVDLACSRDVTYALVVSSIIEQRRAKFRDLHRSGCFIIPNAWDVGSARYLASLGFKAIASTSAGFAFSRGVADNAVGLEDVLEHLRELVDATDLPVNADFEN